MGGRAEESGYGRGPAVPGADVREPDEPVTALVLAFVAAVLIGFPLLIAAVELRARELVLVAAATAPVCVGLVVWIARRYARDHERLLAGEHLAR